MNAHTSPTRRPLLKALRSRKLRAILASGLVLGLGATVTLAAWNDSEYAQATFTAGRFNLEVSTNQGTTYFSDTGSPAELQFTTPSTNLSPTDVVFSSFVVRLASYTTKPATVTMSSSKTVNSVANLTYSVIQATTGTCNKDTLGAELVPAGTPVGTVPDRTAFSLAPGVASVAGAPAYLCFAVKAGANLVQEQSGSAAWQFAAESQPN